MSAVTSPNNCPAVNRTPSDRKRFDGTISFPHLKRLLAVMPAQTPRSLQGRVSNNPLLVSLRLPSILEDTPFKNLGIKPERVEKG